MTATPTSRPNPRRRRHLPVPLAVALLGAVFAVALLTPMPFTRNTAEAQVVATVEHRLPGWSIVRTNASWEGAWSVVAWCGGQQLGFQLVPGHGLSPGDVWLHPDNEYARVRLASISDDYRFLVWFSDPIHQRSLSCRQELARDHAARPHRTLD
ncbi:MAG TPA: hypothetical protein VIA82_00190 [Candidatus Limnocylindria bacterium]|jgi:hypothetical protein